MGGTFAPTEGAMTEVQLHGRSTYPRDGIFRYCQNDYLIYCAQATLVHLQLYIVVNVFCIFIICNFVILYDFL